MKTLIVPDVHNHIDEVEAQISRYPADRVVFLGDYFDSFGDTPAMAEATARWLKASLARPERLHLWGNHDLWYRFPLNSQICWIGSGFTPEKSRAISGVLAFEDWEKLRLVTVLDGIVFSHAGVDRSVFEHPVEGLSAGRVESQCAAALEDAAAGIDNEVLGEHGIVWLRWWEMEALPEFSQVVGHTVARECRVETEGGRFNVCLDTLGRYLGLLEDGIFKVIDDERDGAMVWSSADPPAG